MEKYGGEKTSVMSVRVILMTNPSKYHHLPPALYLALFLSHFKLYFTQFDSLLPSRPAAPFFLLDKLFGKRLLQARHYIMSRKSWLKMVPTENCDILMTFPGTEGSGLSSLFVL